MIHLLREKASPQQVHEMLAEHSVMIKIVVDIRRKALAGGGQMHADCETALLDDGSAQDDLWGANWYPADQRIEFEALINIRPALGNRSIILQSEALRRSVEAVTRALLGDVE
jgi:hypothetical protein